MVLYCDMVVGKSMEAILQAGPAADGQTVGVPNSAQPSGDGFGINK